MKPHALDAPDRSGSIAHSFLSRPNSRSTAPPTAVQLCAALGLTRGDRMEARRLDPYTRGLAFASRTAPLRSAPLEVRASEGPDAVAATRRLVVAALDGGSLAQRRDRQVPLSMQPSWIGSLSYPASMIAVLIPNPRSRAASMSASAKVCSESLAVSVVHARGRSVAVQTAAWAFYHRALRPCECLQRSEDP
jgi:hypothetical protein